MIRVPSRLRIDADFNRVRRGLQDFVDQVTTFLENLPKFQILKLTLSEPDNEGDTVNTDFPPVGVVVLRAVRQDGAVTETAVSFDWTPTSGGFVINEMQGTSANQLYDFTLLIIGERT